MASKTEFPGDLSPFRTGYQIVELFYDGVWNAIPATDISQSGITIRRSAEGPASMSLELRNGDGRYSPRNPRSPLFGKIGRNTPIRVRVQMQTAGPIVDRFTGEVTEWPQKWGRKGAPSVYSPIECAGILRRLGQGAPPLPSPMKRAALSAVNGVAYWPMEDATGSASFAAGIGTEAATPRGGVKFADYSGFAASDPLPTLQSGSVRAVVPTYTSTGAVQIRCLMFVPTGTLDQARLMSISLTGGTITTVNLHYSVGGALRLQTLDAEGTSLSNNTIGFAIEGEAFRLSIELANSGSDVSRAIRTYTVGDVTGLALSGTITGQSVGRPRVVSVNPDSAALAGFAVGHVLVEKAISGSYDTLTASVLNAHFNERASDRIYRLCGENGITANVGFPLSPSERMGTQGRDTLVALLNEAAASNGGLLFESRGGTYDLEFRDLEGMYSQTPALSVPYTDNLLTPFEPTDDDATTRNKVTVTRKDGSAAAVERTTGSLSTQPAPAGVGIYDEEVTLSVATVDAAREHASWRVALGTHDEARWPVIGLDLAHPTFLASASTTSAILDLDIGDRVDVSGLPAWLPPDDVRVIITGYTERIEPLHYKFEFSTDPARPYQIAKYSSGSGPARYTTAGAMTSATLSASATSVPILLGRRRFAHDDGDYPIVIGGERMTVTAVTAPASGAQTLTVVRAVNGVSKTHSASAAVELAEPYRYAL